MEILSHHLSGRLEIDAGAIGMKRMRIFHAKLVQLAAIAGLLMMIHPLGAAGGGSGTEKKHHSQVHSLKVTILSTMLADDGVGEWGFAALVEADHHRILVDTGARPRTVLENAHELGVDLSTVQEVILTHNHSDHVGGLITLRRELRKANPSALSRIHVAKGIFYSRPAKKGGEDNTMIAIKRAYEATGGVFIEHENAAEIFPGAWLTGPVPRVYPERNWSGTGQVRTPQGLVEDNIPEDQSLILNTDKGLILIAGCGHAGVINTLTFARNEFPETPVYAVLGGLHLFAASEKQVDWTADKLKEFGTSYLLGAHCTGIESVYRIRQRIGLTRRSAVVGAVGATFVLGEGIHPGLIAQ